jgi:MFS family permease
MFGVLYCYTPEVFPTNVRGTAVGIASSLGRISGCIAPILTGALLDISLSIPLYLSASFLCIAAVFMVMLPLETRGKAAL